MQTECALEVLMRNRKRFGGRVLMVGLIGTMAAAVMATAQTTGSPYEPEVQNLVLEGKVDLANLKPKADEGLTAFVGNGELRVRVDNWNFRGRNYRLTVFAVPAGAPLPTPQVPDSASPTVLIQAVVRTESIFHVRYEDSGPGVAFAGRVNQRLGGLGTIEPGEVWMFGFAYPPDAINETGPVPVTYRQVTFWTPNATNAYIGEASGALQVRPPRIR